MNWNPNQNDPYAPPQGQYPGQGGPYDPYGQPQKPRSSGLTWLWILLGGGGVLFLVCCGACCGLAYVGMEDEERQLQTMFEDHEIIREQIGQIQSIDRDWSKSMDEEDDDIWYYRIEGDKGDGYIIIKEEGLDLTEDDLQLEWAKLQTDAGEEFEIYP